MAGRGAGISVGGLEKGEQDKLLHMNAMRLVIPGPLIFGELNAKKD